jgi:hypothetical protein
MLPPQQIGVRGHQRSAVRNGGRCYDAIRRVTVEAIEFPGKDRYIAGEGQFTNALREHFEAPLSGDFIERNLCFSTSVASSQKLIALIARSSSARALSINL